MLPEEVNVHLETDMCVCVRVFEEDLNPVRWGNPVTCGSVIRVETGRMRRRDVSKDRKGVERKKSYRAGES